MCRPAGQANALCVGWWAGRAGGQKWKESDDAAAAAVHDKKQERPGPGLLEPRLVLLYTHTQRLQLRGALDSVALVRSTSKSNAGFPASASAILFDVLEDVQLWPMTKPQHPSTRVL